jgi:hypothetical protein
MQIILSDLESLPAREPQTKRFRRGSEHAGREVGTGAPRVLVGYAGPRRARDDADEPPPGTREGLARSLPPGRKPAGRARNV